ncbi:sulfatase [Haliscomenobacter hydrossis]|uniref:Sulfatase n=1 Tax=Haliscomenobacter hydrossis (strain ATCC 27775 / DSM 1100 / LMG 10767 / O) TaxID=760192 RepID=F4KXQ3_HALH1|nr:sulfatase [Haliscomenobacter hydrossis]AEE51414.1 sulfatase [Haliscomenobacter hydrossis DSM 1100]
MHQFYTALLLITLCNFQQIFAQDRPNILWISAEDLSPHFASYGDNTVKTPNIDRLAKEGIVYERVYTTAGVCAPSRCAIITGNYQTRVGGHNMRTLNSTYPEKTGLPKEYNVVPPAEIRCFPEYLRAAGYYTCNNEKTDYQFTAPPTVWDESSKTASWRKRPAGKPFFAVINFTTTHESQVWARSKNPLRVDPAKVPLPPYYPDNALVRTDVARHYSNLSELDDQVGEVLQQLEADGLLDKTIIFFWTDHGDGLPFFKREIYRRGLHIPLIIRFPNRAQAGTRNQSLISAIDFGPTVLSLAGIPTPPQMDGRAFLGKYAAKKGRKWVFAARDRMDSEYDRSRSVMNQQFQYVRNFYPERPRYQNIEYRTQQPGMAEMLRLKAAGQLQGDQLLWFEPTKPREELYDWVKDPFQLHNLADLPEYSTTLKKMRKVMDQWLVQTKDLGGIPERELVKQMWNGGDKPPLTSAPSIQMTSNELRISCATPGASIAFREKGSSTWEVYTQPIPKPLKTIEAMAMRIGYTASEIVTFN